MVGFFKRMLYFRPYIIASTRAHILLSHCHILSLEDSKHLSKIASAMVRWFTVKTGFELKNSVEENLFLYRLKYGFGWMTNNFMYEII